VRDGSPARSLPDRRAGAADGQGRVRRTLATILAGAALAGGCGGAGSGESSPPPIQAATGATLTGSAPAGLQAGPFTPLDADLFGPPYYPKAVTFAPATGPPRGPDDLLGEAQALVGFRDPALAERAAELFSDEKLRTQIPSPALRAAAVSLLGTIAEPAIDWLTRDGGFSRVEFGELDGPALAKSLTGPDGLQRIVVERRLRFEKPALLSVVLAHEALHSDARVSDIEELVATAFQALVHMQQLLADPSLAEERTRLAQATNAWLLIRINTRQTGAADLRLVLADDGPTVLPGGLDRPYFAAFFDPAARPTPGNPYLAALTTAVAEPGVEPPSAPDFDFATIDFLDRSPSVLTSSDLLELARLLHLGAGPAA
jgi:hypothetical protein